MVYALQLSLGAIFLLSAVSKLRDAQAFSRTVVEYQIIGPRASILIAPMLIVVECLLAAAFLTGVLIEAALALSGVTLLVFATATTINLRRGREVPCGCFGDSTERITVRTLARLAFLSLAIAVLVVALASGQASETTLAELSAHGVSALAYFIDVAGIAVVLIFATVWVLNAPEVAPVLRSAAGRAPNLPEVGGGDAR